MLVFKKPGDIVEFEERWSQEFVRKAENMPGLRRVAISRIKGKLTGDLDLHLVHEFFFDDGHAVCQAMASPEGQAAGEALMRFAADSVTLCFAEHLEEDRQRLIEGG